MTATCADPPFVFLHVPRTGGFAFYRYLERHVPAAEIIASAPRRTHMTAAMPLDDGVVATAVFAVLWDSHWLMFRTRCVRFSS